MNSNWKLYKQQKEQINRDDMGMSIEKIVQNGKCDC